VLTVSPFSDIVVGTPAMTVQPAYNRSVLAPSICDRARLARDRRFDGRFFTGVLTKDLLSTDLSGEACALSQRAVLSLGGGRRARRPGAAPRPA
jgi:hypothetical protein